MPRTPTVLRTPHPGRRHRPLALLAVLALAACGAPPELRTPPAVATPAPVPSTSATPTPSATTVAPVTPSAPVLSPSTPVTATPCRGRPSGDRIVALLRGSAGVLPRDVRVTVATGPLCAEGWQYTVLAVTGHEELQVVTRGGSGTPTLVTAGTDVCGVEVRTLAPPGIRTLACDGTPGA
ncbi:MULTISPECIES: hypothetical protein [Micromonospora]|uniref:hypothetical protein n=1 Tax=Micromonospora TaxID=1873 RepID=UPI0005B94DE1|nr:MULTISPECIES: hypothetical protein [Micromonospora]MCK1804828.1 hypothetical protein [Micromonospora sp. R42106]MCK1831153.1 hypothetical protein [Micromonospora sp. R42003]MCK1842258.1 hypothetical protein [Micromonospora sp. R42004]MCM1018258.1 hypothetical protein [Micromonospora sp. XM-20-01]PPA56793.1 hypothetical protein BAW75_05955 [Micromonospora chalcea]